MCFLRENYENTWAEMALALSSKTGSLLLELPSPSKERQSGRLHLPGFLQALRYCVLKVIRLDPCYPLPRYSYDAQMEVSLLFF